MRLKKHQASSLSKSIIWDKMQEYYEQLGPTAWQDNLVPYQITSNKLLAHLYVTLIKTQLFDNSQEKFYILELGAGHGKFSYYILKFLEFFNINNFLYVASDISQQNIDYWQTHPKLQQYIVNKKLDFAKYDPAKDSNIYLINSKVTIQQHSLKCPIFVIANYIFDTLRHDAFQIKNNQLFATNIIVKHKNEAKKSFKFNNLKYNFCHEPINNNYYSQQDYNKILAIYSQQLSEGSFLLPIGALQSIDNIRKLSNDTVFLVADKGNTCLSEFTDLENPNIAEHGSVSLMVNFHAIQQFFSIINGHSILMPNNNSDLQIGCFSANKIHYLLNLTATNILYDINPQNLINIFYANDNITKWKNLDQILAVLALSKWDPDLFYDLAEQLTDFIDKTIDNKTFNIEQEKAILQGINLVWEYFFKLEKNQDLPFVLANIYYSLEKFDLAAKFFKISVQEFGESKEAIYNIKLCQQAKRAVNEAYS